ncbi:DUF3817 domain-containing protein [Corynebacterium tapiri]|uniref:DUF3817 domain-containing protein n=1 Tax=Corynebacterium tapiri TaxID=1448266 RepID=A0A5C4U2Q9_9CORY|nr:DUF3817 domain-containing protein [Corynebacterium tapiri]
MTTSQAPRRVHPERQRRVRTAFLIFSAFAWLTGILLLALVTRMICEYLLGMDIPVWAEWIGRVHGWVYGGFLLATVNLGTTARWKPIEWLLTALGGVVPLLSFFVEEKRHKEVREQFQLAPESISMGTRLVWFAGLVVAVTVVTALIAAVFAAAL